MYAMDVQNILMLDIISAKLKIDIQTHNCKLVYHTIKMSSPIAMRIHDDLVAESAFVKRRFA